MKSIITQLFKGEVYPGETILPQSQEYDVAKDEKARLLEKLEATLSKEQVQLLSDMLDVDADACLLQFEAYYAEGVRFGIQLMRELFPLDEPEWAGKRCPDEQ